MMAKYLAIIKATYANTIRCQCYQVLMLLGVKYLKYFLNVFVKSKCFLNLCIYLGIC